MCKKNILTILAAVNYIEHLTGAKEKIFKKVRSRHNQSSKCLTYCALSEPGGRLFHRGRLLDGSRLLPHPSQPVAGGRLSALVEYQTLIMIVANKSSRLYQMSLLTWWFHPLMQVVLSQPVVNLCHQVRERREDFERGACKDRRTESRGEGGRQQAEHPDPHNQVFEEERGNRKDDGNIQLRRLDTSIREFRLLHYNLTAARAFFQVISTFYFDSKSKWFRISFDQNPNWYLSILKLTLRIHTFACQSGSGRHWRRRGRHSEYLKQLIMSFILFLEICLFLQIKLATPGIQKIAA